MYNALHGSDYLRGIGGMHRQTAPGIPNALDTSSYTNLNGDPQRPLQNYARNQAQIGNIQASFSQKAADALQGVREKARGFSQKEYDQQFLNRYVAENLYKADEADDLIRLGMSMSPDETAEIIRESMVAGSPSFDVGVPYIPGKNLEGVPNAENMREVLKRKYLKNPGGQETLLIPNLRKA